MTRPTARQRARTFLRGEPFRQPKALLPAAISAFRPASVCLVQPVLQARWMRRRKVGIKPGARAVRVRPKLKSISGRQT